jgi:hypothetical protein
VTCLFLPSQVLEQGPHDVTDFSRGQFGGEQHQAISVLVSGKISKKFSPVIYFSILFVSNSIKKTFKFAIFRRMVFDPPARSSFRDFRPTDVQSALKNFGHALDRVPQPQKGLVSDLKVNLQLIV